MKRIKLSQNIFAQVVLAMLLGIACGLFFGEFTAKLQLRGDAYVRLLVMTVLPYVVAALVSGIGRLNPAWVGRIGLRAAGLMLFLWLVSLVTVLLIPIAFPEWKAGSYFSAQLLEEVKPFNPVTAYLPSNIFESLASMQVPAVVVFCVALGGALMVVHVHQGSLVLRFRQGRRSSAPDESCRPCNPSSIPSVTVSCGQTGAAGRSRRATVSASQGAARAGRQ